LYKP
jgi:hypothetical protein